MEKLPDGSACLAFDVQFSREGQTASWDWISPEPLDLSSMGHIQFDVLSTNGDLAEHVALLFAEDGNGASLYSFQFNGIYSTFFNGVTQEWSTRIVSPFAPLSVQEKVGMPDWKKIRRISLRVVGSGAGQGTFRLRKVSILPKDPSENLLKNGSFEISDNGMPYAWGGGHWGEFELPWSTNMDRWRRSWHLDTTTAKDGNTSLCLENEPGLPRSASNPTDYKILFVGNSITQHGFDANTIEKLKWDHLSGMAATSEGKDYVHTLAALIQKTMPTKKITLSFTHLVPGGNGSTDERLEPVKPFALSKYDLVIIQHGEHEKQANGVDAIKGTYEKLLAMFAGSPQQLVLCVGVWSPPWGMATHENTYSGWGRTIEDTMRQIASSHGLAFISVEDIAMAPANHGWGEHDGVRWHPNDRGHQMYAEKIFEAYQSEIAKRSATPQRN